jgi:hypothetical protein
MDVKCYMQVCVKLERGKESSSLQFSHQQTNVLHGSFLLCLLRDWHGLQSSQGTLFCRETVLKYPMFRHTNIKSVLVPEEFVAELKRTSTFARMW